MIRRRTRRRRLPTTLDLYTICDLIREGEGNKVKTIKELREKLQKLCKDNLFWDLLEMAKANTTQRERITKGVVRRISKL